MFDDDDLALLGRQPATLDDTTTVDEARVAPRRTKRAFGIKMRAR